LFILLVARMLKKYEHPSSRFSVSFQKISKLGSESYQTFTMHITVFKQLLSTIRVSKELISKFFK